MYKEGMERQMIDQKKFMEKINRLKEKCQMDPSLTREEVEAEFQEDGLTAAQMQLVFEVLFPEKKEPEYTEEEKAYLKAYEDDIRAMKPEEPGERARLLDQMKNGTQDAMTLPRLTELYLPKVIEKAKEYRTPEVTIDELVEEGNISLMLALGETAPEMLTEEFVLFSMEAGMRVLAEDVKNLKSQDQKLVERVQMLDDAITELTEELGRKVTIYELCDHLDMSEKEVQDIMKLAGEDPEEEQEGDE